MTLEEARRTVAAKMNTSLDALVISGIDLVNQALNNARLYAEREHDFFAMQDQVPITANYNTTFVIPNFKQIRNAYLQSQSYISGPITIISMKDVHRRSRYFTTLPEQEISNIQYSKSRELALVMVNPLKAYLFPQDASANQAVTLLLDVIAWAPSYSHQPASYEDYFLANGYDFLNYRAIAELKGRPEKPASFEMGMAMDALRSLINHDIAQSEKVYDATLN